MKVIYIVGMGRSGSTLLDILLDSHSNVRSLGGMRRLAHYARKHPCACGAPSFWECDFWSQVNKRIQERTGHDLTTLDVDSRNRDTFREANNALFESAAEVAGTEYVTDNSKSVLRLKRLLQHPDLEVIPVHVLRDPRGRAESLRKRKGQKYIPTFSYSHRSLRLYALLRNRPHIVVNYDALAAEPEAYLRKLMARVGIEFEPAQLQWADHPHHNIGSMDVLRKTDGSTIRPDNAWQQNLSPRTQRIINAIAWPGRIVNRVKEQRWGVV